MAELAVENGELVVRLGAFEKMEAAHGELRFPASSVTGVEVLSDAIHAVHGLKAPGTGVPGHVAVGTFRERGNKTFAVVHHDTPEGVRITLTGEDFDELIIGCASPDAVAQSIKASH